MDVSLKLFVLVDLGVKTKHSELTESLIQSSHDYHRTDAESNIVMIT